MDKITIFVISLKNSEERRKYTSEHFAELGIDFEFFDAINGREMSDKELNEAVWHYELCALTKGEIGCSLSHIGVYKEIVKRKIPFAVVLEDNTILLDTFKNAVKEIYEFDLKLKKPAIYHLFSPTRVLKKTKIALKTIDLYRMYSAYGTKGYAINLQAAEKMAKSLSPVRYVADEWRRFRYSIPATFYATLPWSVEVAPMQTTVPDRNTPEIKKKEKIYKRAIILSDLKLQLKILLGRFERVLFKQEKIDRQNRLKYIKKQGS